MNKNVNQRDNMLFGEPYKEEHYSGGVRWFDGINYTTLKWLVDQGYADPEETQNESPTIKEFLEEAKQFDEDGYYITFDGYAVSAVRDDYRVSIDSVNIEIPFSEPDMLARFVNLYCYADEFGITPDNLRKVYTLRAWWD